MRRLCSRRAQAGAPAPRLTPLALRGTSQANKTRHSRREVDENGGEAARVVRRRLEDARRRHKKLAEEFTLAASMADHFERSRATKRSQLQAAEREVDKLKVCVGCGGREG